LNKYRNNNLIELITLAKNDDFNALNEIVRRYQEKVYDAFKKLHPDNELSDLTQEAISKMAKSIKTLKSPEKFNAWLQQIVHNIFYDSLRKNKIKNNKVGNPISNNMDNEFGPCTIDRSKTPDENILSCELKEKINIAIKKLPELLKTIIILREIDGLSYEEIAELTQSNINTVKSRLARARIKLKKELSPYLNMRD